MRAASRRRLTLFAVLAACALVSPGRATTAPPPPPDVAPIAAEAGAYFAFRVPSAAARSGTVRIPPELDGSLWEARRIVGIDLFDARDQARFGVDPQRPVILSWGIVDSKRLRQLLASPEAPKPLTTFAVRYWLVVPVVDSTRAESALDQLVTEPACARPQPDDPRWERWLARRQSTEDHRAAQTIDARYVCSTMGSAVVARSNRSRGEVHWTFARGLGALISEVAPRPPPAVALGERLRQAGFFTANVGCYTTPVDEARAYAGYELLQMMLTGHLHVTVRQDLWWKQRVHQLGAPSRLVESEPRLFSDRLVTDHTRSWGLTTEGRTFFSSLGLPTRTDVIRLRKEVAAKPPPKGAFATPAVLERTFFDAGRAASDLGRHFLWPHLLGFAAAHPGERQYMSDQFSDDLTEVELDVEHGQLRLRAADRRK